MKFYVMLTVMFMLQVNAEQTQVISMDRSLGPDTILMFPNEQNVQPELSDFSILNSLFMSNQAGDRWAVVTLRNTASGNRSLEQNHLMALLGNGKKVTPQPFKISLAAQEVQSITIYVGKYQFPILQVLSRLPE